MTKSDKIFENLGYNYQTSGFWLPHGQKMIQTLPQFDFLKKIVKFWQEICCLGEIITSLDNIYLISGRSESLSFYEPPIGNSKWHGFHWIIVMSRTIFADNKKLSMTLYWFDNWVMIGFPTLYIYIYIIIFY